MDACCFNQVLESGRVYTTIVEILKDNFRKGGSVSVGVWEGVRLSS